MLPIVQLLLYGLIACLVLIPVSRWFWKKWDLPSRQTKEQIAEQRREREEERMWREKEAELQAEIAEKKKWERTPEKEAPSEDAKQVALDLLDQSKQSEFN